MRKTPQAGDLWIVTNDNAYRYHAGDLITVVWVQPEAEAAVPWIRDVSILVPSGRRTMSLQTFERRIKSGDLSLIQEAQREEE